MAYSVFQKAVLQDIWIAETREEVMDAFENTLVCFEAKYPKAMECLRETLCVNVRIPRESCHLIHTKSATLQHELVTLDNPGIFSSLFNGEKNNAREEVIHAQDKGSAQVKSFRPEQS